MITKNRLLIIFGIWITILPFLGFPSSFKNFFTILSGAIVTLLAFLIAKNHHPKMHEHEVVTEVYTQKKAMYPEFPTQEESNDPYTDLDVIKRQSEKLRS